MNIIDWFCFALRSCVSHQRCSFLQFPKKFARIAASLPNKTTAECVRFYYRSKKHLKFKEKVCRHPMCYCQSQSLLQREEVRAARLQSNFQLIFRPRNGAAAAARRSLRLSYRFTIAEAKHS